MTPEAQHLAGRRQQRERTLRLEDIGEAANPLQQLPVGHRQLVAGLVALPENTSCRTKTFTYLAQNLVAIFFLRSAGFNHGLL